MLLVFALLLDSACASPPAQSARIADPPAAAGAVSPLSFPAGTPLGDLRAALAAHPEGVALTLTRGARAWTADEIEALVHKSPEAKNLRALVVAGSPVGAAGAMAIAASPHLGGLRALDLRGCRIGEAGARGLGYSPGLAALETLFVDAADPGPKGLEALRARYGERLVLE